MRPTSSSTSDLFTADDLWQPDHPDAAKFLDFVNGWVLLTNVLNELSRSMGQPDYYPFVMPRTAVGKLQFIHRVITEQRPGSAPTMVVASDRGGARARRACTRTGAIAVAISRSRNPRATFSPEAASPRRSVRRCRRGRASTRATWRAARC
jgi:hypothetical protein